MPNRRVDSPAIRIAIVCCFALAIVPRATVYTHEHAGETPGHVHAWDGARLDSVRELIDAARGGHDHTHPHAHPHDDRGDGRDRAGDGGPPQRPAARKADARRPGYAAAAGSAAHHEHTQAPFQSVARSIATPLPLVRLQAPVVAVATVRPLAGVCPALRARSPPSSVQV